MKRVLISLVGLIAVIGVAATFILNHGGQAGPKRSAAQFAQAWNGDNFGDLSYVDMKSTDVADQYKAASGPLRAYPVHVVVGKVHTKGTAASATMNVSWAFGGGNWNYSTQLSLKKVSGKWMPVWSISTIQPALTQAGSLQVARVQPKRADILGAGGQVLVTDTPVVEIGVEPQRTADPDGLAKKLSALLSVDADSLSKQIKAAKPDAFVSVITLRQSDYDGLKAKLQPLPGTVFLPSTLPLAPTRQFASALLGRVGPVTADVLKNSSGRYVAGDIAGLSGLQLQYDKQLAGTAGVTVDFVGSQNGAVPQQLFKLDGIAGQPLTLTLDTKSQTAADDALSGQTKPSALIAIQASTGNILAVSNGPDVGGVDNAFVGRYPPGSSFKVITSYALLQKGVTTGQSVACPSTINVGGRTFKNAENESFGAASFAVDFAKSCNTAFIGLSSKVPGSTLPDTAKLFGIGTDWNLGVSAFSGSVPEPKTDIDLAATAFGQGNTLVSPLAMANVAATVDFGAEHQPRLIADSTQPSATSTLLDTSTISTLQSLMRQVVTSGTGTAVANVPGGDVYGKTGTAEFGNDNPPQAHAWFIGYQADIAFAVFVEGGEFGGDTAAPIAAKFLTELSR